MTRFQRTVMGGLLAYAVLSTVADKAMLMVMLHAIDQPAFVTPPCVVVRSHP